MTLDEMMLGNRRGWRRKQRRSGRTPHNRFEDDSFSRRRKEHSKEVECARYIHQRHDGVGDSFFFAATINAYIPPEQAAAPRWPPDKLPTTSSKARHQSRPSLLDGDSAYAPLTGGTAGFASAQPPIYDPLAPGAFPSGGYHDRQGLPTTAVLAPAAGPRKVRSFYKPNTTWTWAFLLVTILQAAINLCLQGYVFGKFQASLNSAARGADAPVDALTIPTYLALFLFGFLYELVLVWDALRAKNTIQVIGICLYNLGMLIYSAVEIGQVDVAVADLVSYGAIEDGVWPDLRPFLIAAPCTLALGTVLLSFIAWKLYDEFAWSIYKHISADLRMKRRYLTYQIYIALLKFDFFFFLGFTVQFLVVVRKGTSIAEFALTIAAIPITVLVLLLAAWFTRRESYGGQIFVIFVYVLGLAYFFFKLVRMYDSPKARFYESARHSLTAFAVLTLLLLLATIVVAILCMRNFNKGLRQHIQSSRSKADAGLPATDYLAADGMGSTKYAPYNSYGHTHPLGTVGVSSRFEID